MQSKNIFLKSVLILGLFLGREAMAQDAWTHIGKDASTGLHYVTLITNCNSLTDAANAAQSSYPNLLAAAKERYNQDKKVLVIPAHRVPRSYYMIYGARSQDEMVRLKDELYRTVRPYLYNNSKL